MDSIVWASTHNSMSSMADGWVTPNHYFGIDAQLAAGVRTLMIDIWNSTVAGSTSKVEIPHMCHAVCALGKKPLVDEFRVMERFLRGNTTEVLMLVIEQYSNTKDILAIMATTGLDKYAWTPSGSPTDASFAWPTLQALIDTGKRLIVFTDTKKTNKISFGIVPAWYLYQFDYMYETNYAVSDKASFTCQIGRGSDTNIAIMKRKMTLLNHFITNPVASPMLATDANQKDLITKRVADCKKTWAANARIPNLVAVDFWSVGNFLQTIDDINTAL